MYISGQSNLHHYSKNLKKMKLDFFTYLPSQIINNIFLRLPIQTIAVSKCVSKPWLRLLKSDEFVNSHLAQSVPALAVLTSEEDSSSCTVFKFEEEGDLDPHDLRYHPHIRFDIPHYVGLGIAGSANGLLFLWKSYEVYCVCNPITREYIELHFPEELTRPFPKVVNYPEILEDSVHSYPPSTTYGFGASRVSGKYKVVRISHGSVIVHTGEARRRIIPESECYVYTLGTDSWRRVEPGAPFEYVSRTSCVFVNGNLHWIVSDSNEKLWISCFDLETERFSSFSTPPLFQEEADVIAGLSALGDCLCLCDHTAEQETAIWLMRDYGVVNSWTKEYTIILNNEFLDVEGWELIYPLKVFKDGDILMLREDMQLIYFSTKAGIAREVGISPARRFYAVLITPSFLSLKSFGMETVESF